MTISTTQETPSTTANISANLGKEGAETKEVVDPLTRVIPSPPVQVQSREELDPILQRHQKWVDAVLSPRTDILEGRANLAGADLSGFDLSGVNLSGATLTGTKLIGTLFRGAILKGTDFTGAHAAGADFHGAKLQRAKFERADLRDTEFTNADVTGADFRFARRGTAKEEAVAQDFSTDQVAPDAVSIADHSKTALEGEITSNVTGATTETELHL